MDNCVVPIELIEVICKYEYANWAALIRTCKQICECLMPLRWAAKSAVTRVYYNSPMSVNNQLFVVCIKGKTTYEIIVFVREDCWEVTKSVKSMYDDSLQRAWSSTKTFKNNRLATIYWDINNERVGSTYKFSDGGYIYYLGTFLGASRCMYVSRSEMLTKLSNNNIDCKWVRYIG
jgi:hypothetical protein